MQAPAAGWPGNTKLRFGINSFHGSYLLKNIDGVIVPAGLICLAGLIYLSHNCCPQAASEASTNSLMCCASLAVMCPALLPDSLGLYCCWSSNAKFGGRRKDEVLLSQVTSSPVCLALRAALQSSCTWPGNSRLLITGTHLTCKKGQGLMSTCRGSMSTFVGRGASCS